jgi:hypothetical protein
MENNSGILSNQELADLLKTTFAYTLISSSIDNEEDEDTGGKIGQLVIETCMDEFLSNAIENAFNENDEFDLDSVMESFMVEMDNDFDGFVSKAESHFETLDHNMKVKVLSAVYRALLLDGNISETEESFLELALGESNVTLDEIKKHIEDSNNMKSLLDLTDDESE